MKAALFAGTLLAVSACALLDRDARDPLSRARARARHETASLGSARGDVTITKDGLFVMGDDDEVVWHARDALAEAPARSPLRVRCAGTESALAALVALQTESRRAGAEIVLLPE